MHSAKITIIADQEININGDEVNIHHLNAITVYGDRITDYSLKPAEQIQKEESDLAEKVLKKEETMTKYMTMQQAFECGDDDSPYIKGHFNDGFRVMGYTKKAIMSGEMGAESVQKMIENSLSDQWQVIKANPDVLTAEVFFKKTYPGYYGEAFGSGQMMGMFDSGDKNGWNRTKELRDFFDKVISRFGSDAMSYENLIDDLKKILVKIKPPEKDYDIHKRTVKIDSSIDRSGSYH